MQHVNASYMFIYILKEISYCGHYRIIRLQIVCIRKNNKWQTQTEKGASSTATLWGLVWDRYVMHFLEVHNVKSTQSRT